MLEGQNATEMEGRRIIDRGVGVAINQDLLGQKFSLNYFRPLLGWMKSPEGLRNFQKIAADIL